MGRSEKMPEVVRFIAIVPSILNDPGLTTCATFAQFCMELRIDLKVYGHALREF
jgi:hypothetical protein